MPIHFKSYLILSILFSLPLTAQAETDADRLMNFAETTYPALFAPASQPTQTIGNEWVYRVYPETSSAIGVQNSADVFITGPAFGKPFGELVPVGTLSSLLTLLPPVETAFDRGRKLYSNCSDSTCHGSNPARGQNGIFGGRSARNTRRNIDRNRGGMGFLSFLTDAELEDIAVYLQSF